MSIKGKVLWKLSKVVTLCNFNRLKVNKKCVNKVAHSSCAAIYFLNFETLQTYTQ